VISVTAESYSIAAWVGNDNMIDEHGVTREWNHIVTVYDRMLSRTEITELYINGVRQ